MKRLEILNRKAGGSRYWAAVRYSSSLLRQTVDSISPFVTQILVSRKQVRDIIPRANNFSTLSVSIFSTYT